MSGLGHCQPAAACCNCLASSFRLHSRAACWLLVLLQVQVDVQCKALPASLGQEVEQIARDMQGGTSPFFRLGMLMEPGEGDRLMHLLRAQVCDDVCCKAAAAGLVEGFGPT